MAKTVDLRKFPVSCESIDVMDYRKLNMKVFNSLVSRYGMWLYRHKEDLTQVGYIGLLKAKEKYVPGRGSFLGLAWLRINSAMLSEIAQYAKSETSTVALEDLMDGVDNEDSDKLTWEESFEGVILDYGFIFRMIAGEDDRKLLVGLIEQYPYWKLRAILNEEKEEHELRIERIKTELVDIVEVLHSNATI